MCLGRVVSLAAILALFGAGILAGVVSTVAALASVVSYPVLLALGLPPVSANVTNTVALVFTGAGAAAGSRRELAGAGRLVLRLGRLRRPAGPLAPRCCCSPPPRRSRSSRRGSSGSRRCS